MSLQSLLLVRVSLLLHGLQLCLGIMGGRWANVQQTPYNIQCVTNIEGSRLRFSGSIIDTNKVLTLAYYCNCDDSEEYATDTLVFPGMAELGDSEGSLQVKITKCHPKYVRGQIFYNYCVMRVEGVLTYSLSVQLAGLAGTDDRYVQDLNIIVSGWGLYNVSKEAVPRTMRYHEFKSGELLHSNSFFELENHFAGATARPMFGDGGGPCLHRESVTVVGMVVDEGTDDYLSRPPMCILVGKARQWIEAAKMELDE